MKRLFIWFMNFFILGKSNQYPTDRKSTKGVSRRRWTKKEDNQLLKMYKQDDSLVFMAYILDRSEQAVRRRLYDFGHTYNSKSKFDELNKSEPLIDQAQDNIEITKAEHQAVSFAIDPSLHGKHMYIDPLIGPSEPRVNTVVPPQVRPSNANTYWLQSEDDTLIRMHANGSKYTTIATHLNRSESAILNRHNKLGLLPNR